MVDRFALRTVGRNGIAALELPVRGRQHPTIVQAKNPAAFDGSDGDDLAIGELPAIESLAVGLELQAASGTKPQRLRPADGEAIEMVERNAMDFSRHVEHCSR